jgi:TatD DNase family protein
VRLIDSHCHLQAERFHDDVDEVLAAARAAGLERILVPGWNGWSCDAALELAARHPWLDAGVGVHPHDAAKVNDAEWGRIANLASDERVVAVGETGLDFDRVFSPIPDQLSNLRRNLALARDLGKPAILHVRSKPGQRDAQDAMLEEIDRSQLTAFVIHSFSGPVDYATAAVARGAVISISGLAFRTGEEATGEVAALLPDDRLLVETDSPFLSPPGGPRGRNAPEWVRVTGAWIAERRSAEPEAFGDRLVATYDRTFPRNARPEPPV